MVYLGKPSRGCQTCKTRKVKCDEVRPACSRCRSTGRVCPGYVDEADLVFRNQTQAVRRKAQKALARRQPRPSCESISASSSSFEVETQLSGDGLVEDNDAFDEEILRPLTTSTEDIAVPFFFKHYATKSPPADSARGYMDFLSYFWNHTSSSSPLHLAVSAAALATLSKFPDMRHAKSDATTMYSRALHSAALSLSDPLQSKSDDTLMTIMMLSLCETMTSSQKSIYGFAKHIDGAAALIKHRGIGQFRDPISIGLYRAVRTHTVLNAIQQAKSMDDFPMEDELAGAALVPDNSSNKLTKISIRIPPLRAQANELLNEQETSRMVEKATNLLQAAIETDKLLEQWQRQLPPGFRYRIAATYSGIPENLEEAPIWPGPVHTYSEIPSASLVNYSRTHRLYVLDIMIRCLELLESFHGSDFYYAAKEEAYTASQQMVDEICASVPYHFGFRMLRVNSHEESLEETAADGAGAFYITLPLFVGSGVERMPDDQRRWMRARLKLVAERFGLDMAKILSEDRPFIRADQRLLKRSSSSL